MVDVEQAGVSCTAGAARCLWGTCHGCHACIQHLILAMGTRYMFAMQCSSPCKAKEWKNDATKGLRMAACRNSHQS